MKLDSEDYHRRKPKPGKIQKVSDTKITRVTYGVVNKYEPSTIYIEFKSWVTIDSVLDDKKRLGRKLDKRIRQYINNNINRNLFKNDRTMISIYLPTHVMGLFKSTYSSLEVTLKQSGQIPFKNNNIRLEILKMIHGIEKVLEDSEFNFTKHKYK